MDVLLDQKTVVPLLVGAVLALLGGVITQFIFWRASLSNASEALLSAFRAELRVIRGNLSSSLAGYRLSLRENDPPTPSVFALPTPVFNANAGQLGQLRDNDLVEHIVEVYGCLQALSEQASLYKGISGAAIALRELNGVHIDATAAHISVMKLHNRLAGAPSASQVNLDASEIESREHFAEHVKLLDAGQIGVAYNKKWSDA